MRIFKKRRISTERETIKRIFMRDKVYRMNSNLYTKKSNMPRMGILMNICISTKRMIRTKKNDNEGMKNTTMTKMITK